MPPVNVRFSFGQAGGNRDRRRSAAAAAAGHSSLIQTVLSVMELHHVCNWRLPICSRTVTAGKDFAIPRHLALKKTFVLIDFPNNIHEILKNANRFREKHFLNKGKRRIFLYLSGQTRLPKGARRGKLFWLNVWKRGLEEVLSCQAAWGRRIF